MLIFVSSYFSLSLFSLCLCHLLNSKWCKSWTFCLTMTMIMIKMMRKKNNDNKNYQKDNNKDEHKDSNTDNHKYKKSINLSFIFFFCFFVVVFLDLLCFGTIHSKRLSTRLSLACQCFHLKEKNIQQRYS